MKSKYSSRATIYTDSLKDLSIRARKVNWYSQLRVHSKGVAFTTDGTRSYVNTELKAEKCTGEGSIRIDNTYLQHAANYLGGQKTNTRI